MQRPDRAYGSKRSAVAWGRFMLGLGITALAAFMWSLRTGQYDDLDGAAERILHEETDAPIRNAAPKR